MVFSVAGEFFALPNRTIIAFAKRGMPWRLNSLRSLLHNLAILLGMRDRVSRVAGSHGIAVMPWACDFRPCTNPRHTDRAWRTHAVLWHVCVFQQQGQPMRRQVACQNLSPAPCLGAPGLRTHRKPRDVCATRGRRDIVFPALPLAIEQIFGAQVPELFQPFEFVQHNAARVAPLLDSLHRPPRADQG